MDELVERAGVAEESAALVDKLAGVPFALRKAARHQRSSAAPLSGVTSSFRAYASALASL
jgi:hypothetical protein